MKQRLVAVLLFAFLIASGASFVVYKLVEGKLTALAAPATGKLLVAAKDMPIGTLIRESDLTLAAWPGKRPARALTKARDVAGRGVIAEIYAGEPIMEARLAPRGAGAGLAATIPEGMRAVAVRVNDVVGVAGFVVPGMRVDVLISGLPPNTSSRDTLGTQTRTVLQDIEVLSAGQAIQRDAAGKPLTAQVVNLLVTPAQAETLSLASNETKIQLVLRNPLDTREAKAPGTALAYLFEGTPDRKTKSVRLLKSTPRPASAAAPRAPAPPKPVTMEIIEGSKREIVNVGPPGVGELSGARK